MEYVIYPHKNPQNSISAYLEIHSGSVDESDEQLGVAHFCEHVTYMGSRKRQVLLQHSIKTNAFTDFHHTVFYASSSDKCNIKSIFEALDDVLRGENQFSNERLEKEKAAILSEASIIDTNEYRKNCATVKALHSDNMLSKRFPIGDLDKIAQYNIDDLKKYHLTHYTPRNSTIFLIGDVDSSILPVLNDIMGQFTRDGRVQSPCPKRINHNFSKSLEYALHTSPFTDSISCELLRKRPITPIFTVEDLKSHLLRKIVLRGLSFNFDICHRGSSYISCNANDFDCVNEGCRIQSLSIKSNEQNWDKAVKSAINHIYGLDFRRFPWSSLVNGQILEINKLLPENILVQDLVPLVMEGWSCGHVLMDLRQYCELSRKICESIDPCEAQAEFEEMFSWIDNPHAVLACSPPSWPLSVMNLRDTVEKIIGDRDISDIGLANDLSFDSLLTPEEISSLRHRCESVDFIKTGSDIFLYKFNNGFTATFKDLRTSDNSFHLKLSIPAGFYNPNSNEDAGQGIIRAGKLLLAANAMMEGGAIASKTREQVEIYCCSNLINVNIDMDKEFITICMSANANLLESMLQILHYLIAECKIEEDAFERGKLKAKNALAELKNNLQEFSAAKNLESLYPNRSFLSLTPEMIDNYSFGQVQEALEKVVKPDVIKLSLVGPQPESVQMDELLKLYIGTISARFSDCTSNNNSQMTLAGEVSNSINETAHLSSGKIIRIEGSKSDKRAAVSLSGFAPNGNGLLPNGESIFKILQQNGYNRAKNTPIARAYGLLIQELLGARSFTSLREEEKLTYETIVSVDTPIYANCGSYSIIVHCIPENVDRVVAAAMKMLRDVRGVRPFTLYQFERAKSQLLDKFKISSPDYWIDRLHASQGRDEYLEDFIAKINYDELQFVFNNLYGTEDRFIHTTVVTMG